MMELLILGMTLIVFFSRYLFLEPRLPIQPGPGLLHFLSFSIPAVLAAVIAPMIFVQNQTLQLEPMNPYLLGAVVAAVCMKLTGRALLTVTVSLVIFMVSRFLLSGG